jgi:hypothetical protein
MGLYYFFSSFAASRPRGKSKGRFGLTCPFSKVMVDGSDIVHVEVAKRKTERPASMTFVPRGIAKPEAISVAGILTTTISLLYLRSGFAGCC